jgi:hypothetical protein
MLFALVAVCAGASACFMAGYDLLAPSDGGMDGAPPGQTGPESESGSPNHPDAGDVMSSVDASALDGGAEEDADVADAKAPDAAPMDSGGMDASDAMPDARVDAGLDARMPEASTPDATPPDAMPPDAASDAGPDAMATDASPPCVIDAGCILEHQGCAAGTSCTLVCDAGAYCLLDCDGSTTCNAICLAGSRCEVSSRTTTPPDMASCLGNAACVRRCGSGTGSCGFSVCDADGGWKTCGSDNRCGWPCSL